MVPLRLRPRLTRRAIIASLIETAKLNGINPHAWLTDTLMKLVNRWAASRIENLMPWNYAKRAATPPFAVNGCMPVRLSVTGEP